MPTNLPSSSRRNLERGLRELRAWLHVARADLRDATDPAERPRLRQLVTDLEHCVYQVVLLLHPASTDRTNGDNNT